MRQLKVKPYRTKTYICFDGDNDMQYYNLMKAWKANNNSFFKEFNFIDAHDINTARDSSKEESIKRQLTERIKRSKVLVVLIGQSTRHLFKFVRWEMAQAVKQGIPIIAVNLNGKKSLDTKRCPPIIRDELVMHISFNQKILKYALKNWPDQHKNIKASGKDEDVGPYYYQDSIYKKLNIS